MRNGNEKFSGMTEEQIDRVLELFDLATLNLNKQVRKDSYNLKPIDALLYLQKLQEELAAKQTTQQSIAVEPAPAVNNETNTNTQTEVNSRNYEMTEEEINDILQRLRNAKKFSVLKKKAIAEMTEYYGNAGADINQQFRNAKTVEQILETLSGDERTKFLDFINNTVEGKYLATLTPEEIYAFSLYSTENYKVINSGIRHDHMFDKVDGIEIKQIRDWLDSALSKYEPLSEDLRLYRGMRLNYFTSSSKEFSTIFKDVHPDDLDAIYPIMKTLVGRTLDDLAYASTSPAYNTSFAKRVDMPIVLEILAKKGTQPGAYINQVSKFYDQENEFLLKRGTSLRIVEVEEPDLDSNDNRKLVIKCEIVDNSAQDAESLILDQAAPLDIPPFENILPIRK